MGGPEPEDTLATDAGIASDETVEAASSTPQPHVTTGPVIRVHHPQGPSKLGRYTILRQLGRGGMGAVFEAIDPELGRHVAIKVLRADRDASFSESLRREAQALARLVHPNVVGVHDVGVDDGQLYVVMQLIEGMPIDRWFRDRQVRATEIVDAFRQAGKGLAAAHVAGLVHCDFKPGNVLVDKDGVIRVSDFGLARIGADDTGAIAGTPAYMAPEQFTGVATRASDQYSFCVSLYEVLVGARPFPDTTIQNVDAANARVVAPIPRTAHVPAYVTRVLQRGLAREPADRFPSMEALLAALAPPARRAWLIGGGAVVALAAAAVAVVATRTPAAVERAPQLPRGQPDLLAARRITNNGTAACANAPAIDGDQIVFDRTDGDAVDLYQIPLAGGPQRQLTSAAATWEWRANPGRKAGEVIHLIHDPKVLANATIAYLDLASGRETVAATVEAADAVVTPHGVIYVSKSGEDLRRLQGGHDVVIAHAPDGMTFNQLAVSHAGNHVAAIAFKGKAGSVCVIDVVAGATDCFEARAYGFRPAFGFDDRRLYYATVDGIHGRDLATKADALIIPDVTPEGGLAVTADGHSLVYSDCGARSQIVDLSAKPPVVIVDGPETSEPNGTTTGSLVFLRIVRGAAVLVARVKVGHEVQLTDPDFGSISHPSIRPDGKAVVYRSGKPHVGIYVAMLQSDDKPQRITDNPQDKQPVWINEDTIAFTRYDASGAPTVYVATSDGGKLHALTGTSRRVIGGREHRVLVATTTHLYWVDLDTGVEHDGPAVEGSAISLSPNGRWAVVRSGSNEQVVHRMSLVPLGTAEHLPDLPSGQTIDGAAITDDGHVLVGAQTWSGDLHVVPAKAGSPF